MQASKKLVNNELLLEDQKNNKTYEVIANNLTILVINKEGIDPVLHKKFDGNELPLTIIKKQIFIVYTERFI